MMEACDVLNIIHEKNRKNPDWKNRGLYRLLCNPTLHIMAYERLKSKPGNMTPGTEGETLDGYSLDDIEKNINQLRQEEYQPRPVRRTFIAKDKGHRPLGIPSPRDKIIQECIRLILEAIYEPRFHNNSHGFRPGRSCHTALESMRGKWVGTKWAIKADITACFEQIDHNRLLDILRVRIEDDRFINLIRRFLKAGYMENWEYHKTYSGTPQGSVVSPILMNIYLDKLDQKLANICQQYSQGKSRRSNPAQARLMRQRKQLLMQGETTPSLRANLYDQIFQLNRRILETPAAKYHDPRYTRVKFLRYADDVIVGVIGPKALTEKIVKEMAAFLKTDLKLELSQEKTQIIHLSTKPARFLGYLVKTAKPRLRRRNMRVKGSPHNIVQTVKTMSGNIRLLAPLKELSQKLKLYMSKGKPDKVNGLVNQPIEHIIAHYNSVMRGWYNYYQLAENVSRLNYARYVLQYSLAKTIATKERTSVSKVFRKYGKDIIYEKPNGREIHFFNQPLTRVKWAKRSIPNIDLRPTWIPRRTQTRLLDNCAICESGGRIEMHHVRHIRKNGQKIHGFKLYLAAINRKQIPVCRQCHRDIHNGKYDGPRLSSVLEKIEAVKLEKRGASI